MPRIVLETEEKDGSISRNKNARRLIKKIDTLLATSELYSGTYIIVTGGKIS